MVGGDKMFNIVYVKILSDTFWSFIIFFLSEMHVRLSLFFNHRENLFLGITYVRQYVYMCVCVCVCLSFQLRLHRLR